MIHAHRSPGPSYELAWAAGFFEGEGTFCRKQAQIAQNDLAPLSRFASAVGLGGITGPYQHKNAKGQHYVWATGQSGHIEYLLGLLHHGLSQRRIDQACKVLDELVS